MFFIPGWLLSIITFPGVIVHEFAHQLFCRLARVAVYDVCYFRVGNPAGFVVHEPPRYLFQHVLISVGPFLVNTVAGAAIAAPAAIPVLQFEAGGPIDYFLLWLGMSVAMHAFPSTGDAKSLWSAVSHLPEKAPAKWAIAPIVAVIYAGAVGSFFWLDVAYAGAVALLLPHLLVKLLA